MNKNYLNKKHAIVPLELLSRWENSRSLSGLIPVALGYQSFCTAYSKKDYQAIKTNTLVFCFRGTGYFQKNDELFIINQHQYFVVPAGQAFSYWADDEDPWEICYVDFKGNLSETITHEISDRLKLKTNYVDYEKNMMQEFLMLYDEICNNDIEDNMLKKYLKLNAFFHDILNSSLACVIHISEERMILEQAIRYLKSNLFYQRSIEEIACAVAIPIRKLILLFRKYTGITPIQYFNFLKMQKAAHLLLTSDLRVNEVGREVGLADSLYFSRLFRGHAGIAPKNYRFSFISDQETSPTVQHLHG